MLELQNICYRVSTPDGEQDILKDISITIPDHKLMVFTGPNGGGKTTLAKVIMGLVQPTSGRILYNGPPSARSPATSSSSWRPWALPRRRPRTPSSRASWPETPRKSKKETASRRFLFCSFNTPRPSRCPWWRACRT